MGVYNIPSLSPYIENAFGERFPSDSFMRVGDSVRFVIVLNKKDTYGAIKVRNCIASDSHTLGAEDSLPLITDGCPAENQNTFNMNNNWRKGASGSYMLKTGMIKLFKFRSSYNFFLHCKVIICLLNEMYKCNIPDCSNSTSSGMSGRQKRTADQTESYYVMLSIRFKSEDESKTIEGTESEENYVRLNKRTFVAVITILCILILLLLATSIGFLYLFRREVMIRAGTLSLFEKSQMAQMKLIDLNQDNHEKENEAYI